VSIENAIYAEWDVPANVVAFVTTREGGVSEAPYASFNLATHVGDNPAQVQANRTSLARQMPAKLQWQWLDQVHGNQLVAINNPGAAITADALSTTRPNLVCCVQTADCLPLFVSALDGSEVALIHAGWKGLASGIIENSLASMVTSTDNMAVWLGPAIGPCHFEVGAEVRDCFLTATGSTLELENCFSPIVESKKYMADLYAIARLKLRQLGVQNISGGDHCCYCEQQRFYSYRRDGITGRMLNAIFIEA
jgi:polyphenol oxidase